MASLTEQMEILQRQQAILNEKIKEDEDRKLKDSYTIERLEVFNKGAYKRQNQLAKKRNRNLHCTSELRMINHTKVRFDVILEILKKQDARICELEAIKVKNNVYQGPHAGESWNYL